MAGSREAHDRFELPKPVGYSFLKFSEWQQKACFHGTVTGLFLSLKRFTVADFRNRFRNCNPQEYGYHSFDNLFAVGGCVPDGNYYTYDRRSALQMKARLLATNLRTFSVTEFSKKFREFFFTSNVKAKKRGFESVKDLLKSIPGLVSIGTDTFKVSDGIDLLSKWRNGVAKQSEIEQRPRAVAAEETEQVSKDIIEIGSSSSDDEDEATVKKDSIRSPKTPAKQQNEGTKKKRDSEESKDSSSDSEEESSSSEDEASKFVKEVPAKIVNKRSRGRRPPIFISIDSSDDDERPARKKQKGETSNKKENLSEEPRRATKKQVSSVEEGPQKEPGVSEGVCDHESIAEIRTKSIAPSNKDILNSFSSQSSTSTSRLVTTNPLQMMPSMFQLGPTPYQQLHHFQMQQGIHGGGGVPYMTPGHQPMPQFAPIPFPLQTSSPASIGNKSIPLIDLEADVKKEAVSSDDRSNSDLSGSGKQAANCQLPLMNPGMQNFWAQQFPFGGPQPASSMFHSGFAGGFGAPVLPGFGHPLTPQTFSHQPHVPPMMHPQPQQLPHNIMDFLNAYMGSALPAALQQGANPLELAKKVLDDVYGNQLKPPPQQ